jgi:hypothetical protein
VTYLLKARTVHPEKQRLCKRNNDVTAAFSVLSVPGLYNEDQLPLRDRPETAVTRVGDWCEMVASLRGTCPGEEERPLLEAVNKQRFEDCD